MQDLWAGHRDLLNEGVKRYVDDRRFRSGQLVREQLEASDPEDYHAAALACLAAAEATGASAEAALPGAVAMAYVSQMAVVFGSLENSGGSPSLSTAWGMPRSLNAGDAMFALAQEALLSTSEELTAETRLAAMQLLDAAARELVEALFAADAGSDTLLLGQKVLLPHAMGLGGLLGGGDERQPERLEALGREWCGLEDDDLWRKLASEPAKWLVT